MPTPKESYCIGYKVVFNTGLRLVSSWVNGLICCNLENGQVEYAIGKRTRPNAGCGPLAVFDDVKDVWKYIKFNEDAFCGCARVYRCKYRKSRQAKMFCVDSLGDQAARTAPLSVFPSSTLATWVELIEEVK